jgi:hypothetical protein
MLFLTYSRCPVKQISAPSLSAEPSVLQVAAIVLLIGILLGISSKQTLHEIMF